MNAATALLAPTLDAGRGDDPALLFGDEVITYADLDARSDAFAHACADLGVGRGDRVLMMISDRPEFFVVYLGTMKAGAVAVALNLRMSAADVLYSLEDSACRLFVVDPQFLDVYAEAASRLDRPPVVLTSQPVPGHRSIDQVTRRHDTPFDAVSMDPGDMAFWMYTSGTTGPPKGAIHRHGSALAGDRFLARVLGVGPGDRLFATSKLFFAFSLGHCFFGALGLGATTILLDAWPTPEAAAEVVARHRPTIMLSVPTMFRNMLEAGVTDGEGFRQVRTYVSAGEKLPPALAARWQAVTGAPIVEGIGATETGFLFLANRADEQRAESCGRPLPETEFTLRDEAGAPVETPGAPGIGWVRTDCLADGYWGQPEKTVAAFHDGWYCTGDMFTRDDDGWYYHQGRADDMLKVSGQWVAPAEIEDIVMADDRVGDAAVVSVSDRDGLACLAMFIVAPETDAERLETDLRAALLERLAVYKCPRRVYMVDDMPRTSTGKVRRFVLREMAAALVSDPA